MNSPASIAVLPTLYNENGTDGYVILVLRGYKGITGKYRVGLHTRLEHLAELATSEDCPLENVALFFHGQRVLQSESPASLGIEERSIVTIGWRMDFTNKERKGEELLDRDGVKLVVRDASGSMEFVIPANESIREHLNEFAMRHRYGTKLAASYNGFKIRASSCARDLFVQNRHTFVVDVAPREADDSDEAASQHTLTTIRLTGLVNTPASMQRATKRPSIAAPLGSLKKQRTNADFPSSPTSFQSMIHPSLLNSDDVDTKGLPVRQIVSHKKVTKGFRFEIIFDGDIKKWVTGSEFKKLAPAIHREYVERHNLSN